MNDEVVHTDVNKSCDEFMHWAQKTQKHTMIS